MPTPLSQTSMQAIGIPSEPATSEISGLPSQSGMQAPAAAPTANASTGR